MATDRAQYGHPTVPALDLISAIAATWRGSPDPSPRRAPPPPPVPVLDLTASTSRRRAGVSTPTTTDVVPLLDGGELDVVPARDDDPVTALLDACLVAGVRVRGEYARCDPGSPYWQWWLGQHRRPPLAPGSELADGRHVARIVATEQWWVDSRRVCCLTLPAKALHTHRLSEAAYQQVLASQHGVCGICGEGNKRSGTGAIPLFIDHDHLCCPPRRRTCGRCVRGLLCSGCNGWLGEMELLMRDPSTPQWREAARDYLRRSGRDPDDPQRRDWFRRELTRRPAGFETRTSVSTAGQMYGSP